MGGPTFCLIDHLREQQAFSQVTFGPGDRTNGVLEHLSKEIEEIRESPDDLEEWVDAALLVFDGTLRRGYSPEQIAFALRQKLEKNKRRKWPNWRTVSADRPIEHIREGGQS